VKLLFDQNISYRVIKQILNLFPEAKQTRELGLENSTDKKIWEFAKKNDYTIVSFDADFYDLVTLFGHPPKVIWLRIGNASTQNLILSLEKNAEIMKAFIMDKTLKDYGCLEIDK
jgi:predicted nuclease of predicted toxin-antitoxin system